MIQQDLIFVTGVLNIKIQIFYQLKLHSCYGIERVCIPTKYKLQTTELQNTNRDSL